MTLTDSKLAPVAFWLGFLALGFVTSIGGPDKHRLPTARVQKVVTTPTHPQDSAAGDALAEGAIPASLK